MNDIKTPEELYNYMDNIKYGYLDKNNNIITNVGDEFANDYKLQSPDEVINNKVGVCWDQVELEREFFNNNNIKNDTYFMVYYDNNKCPTHTFLIYEDNNKFYWFEHSWEIYKGIHEYDSLNDALKDIKGMFIDNQIEGTFNPFNLIVYKYDKPSYGIGCEEFYKHSEKGIKIDF